MWVDAKYLRLLEDERTRLLARSAELEKKVEQLERAMLLSAATPAARQYASDVNPLPVTQLPATRRSAGNSWIAMQEEWGEHLTHDAPNAQCAYCAFEASQGTEENLA